jgi:hypothetical protein
LNKKASVEKRGLCIATPKQGIAAKVCFEVVYSCRVFITANRVKIKKAPVFQRRLNYCQAAVGEGIEPSRGS